MFPFCKWGKEAQRGLRKLFSRHCGRAGIQTWGGRLQSPCQTTATEPQLRDGALLTQTAPGQVCPHPSPPREASTYTPLTVTSPTPLQPPPEVTSPSSWKMSPASLFLPTPPLCTSPLLENAPQQPSSHEGHFSAPTCLSAPCCRRDGNFSQVLKALDNQPVRTAPHLFPTYIL